MRRLANLSAENINWSERAIAYHRRKSGEHAEIQIGEQLGAVLRSLPSSGPLFPNLRRVRSGDRATEFKQRCQSLEIHGVTLHSYRYAWAQRAKEMGYPERFAQQALGATAAKAVHRAYAKGDGVRVPSLDAWKEQMERNVVRPDFSALSGPLSPEDPGSRALPEAQK